MRAIGVLADAWSEGECGVDDDRGVVGVAHTKHCRCSVTPPSLAPPLPTVTLSVFRDATADALQTLRCRCVLRLVRGPGRRSLGPPCAEKGPENQGGGLGSDGDHRGRPQEARRGERRRARKEEQVAGDVRGAVHECLSDTELRRPRGPEVRKARREEWASMGVRFAVYVFWRHGDKVQVENFVYFEVLRNASSVVACRIGPARAKCRSTATTRSS